jgi:glycosyltransferase involved in cell wall biosynthesis
VHFIIGANIEDSVTTGMGRQMHGLGDALVRRGHRVDYLFADALGAGVGPRFARLAAPLRAAQSVARIGAGDGSRPIAILHEPIGWPAALLLRRRVRTVAMVHNCEIKCWRVQLKTRAETGEMIAPSSRILWPLTELSQTYATLKTATAVFCLSSEDVAFIRDSLHIASDRIQRIDNGIEPPFLGLPFPGEATERDLLFLGSWLARKGVKILVEALERLAASGIRAKLTLAGTGGSADAIRGALPAAWRGDTEIVPHVPADRLIDLYQRHRIFLLPAITEGIPLAMLEAMACGLCPIVSDVGGVSDVVQNGINGWLVPMLDAVALANAVTRALREPEESRRLARGAHTLMQAYGWERAADQVERFCRARFLD